MGTTFLFSARAANKNRMRRSNPASSFWRVEMRPIAAVR